MVTDTAEKELGIHVQRLYPLRNENHRKLLEKLMESDDIVLPYLYHRDSSHVFDDEDYMLFDQEMDDLDKRGKQFILVRSRKK
jgi:hypothetical protein